MLPARASVASASPSRRLPRSPSTLLRPWRSTARTHSRACTISGTEVNSLVPPPSMPRMVSGTTSTRLSSVQTPLAQLPAVANSAMKACTSAERSMRVARGCVKERTRYTTAPRSPPTMTRSVCVGLGCFFFFLALSLSSAA